LLVAASPNQTVAVVLPEIDVAQEFYEACKPQLVSNLIDAEFSYRIDLSRRHIRHFTSVNNAKGLGFDIVILPCIERFDLKNSIHQNRLYVALTRARQQLVMIGHMSRPASVIDQIWERYEVLLHESGLKRQGI
jgi:DNA helicase IV